MLIFYSQQNRICLRRMRELQTQTIIDMCQCVYKTRCNSFYCRIVLGLVAKCSLCMEHFWSTYRAFYNQGKHFENANQWSKRVAKDNVATPLEEHDFLKLRWLWGNVFLAFYDGHKKSHLFYNSTRLTMSS